MNIPSKRLSAVVNTFARQEAVKKLLPAHTHHLVEQLVTEVSQNQQITECLLPVLQIKISYKQTHIYAQHILTSPKK